MTLIETTKTVYRFKESARHFPRVTAVLSVVRDLSGIPADVLQHAAARGMAIHKGCWALCGGGGGLYWPSVQPELVPYLKGFDSFLRDTRCSVVDKERLIVSLRYGYAGRADLIVQGLSRGLDVVDIKSGVEDPSHALQTAAYAIGYHEVTKTKRPLGRFALYLRSTGAYRLQEMTGASDFNVFLACKQVYEWRQAQNGGNG